MLSRADVGGDSLERRAVSRRHCQHFQAVAPAAAAYLAGERVERRL